jgi:hypothetical protein
MIKFPPIWRVVLLVFPLLFSNFCWAILDLHVQEDLVVYEKASSDSKPISQLAKGDVIVVSPVIYGSFRKVLVMHDGKRVPGYVLSQKIKDSYIVDRDDEIAKEREEQVIKRRYAFGLFGGFFFMQQNPNSYADTTGANIYNSSYLTSTDPVFGFYLDVPTTDQLIIRPYLSFRNTQLKGNATNPNAVNPLTIPTVEIDENLVGLGALLKYYPFASGSYWLGFAGEYAYATTASGTILNQIPFTVANLKKQNYGIAQFATGFDILFNDFQLSPELRAGEVLTAKPSIIDVEFMVGIGVLL